MIDSPARRRDRLQEEEHALHDRLVEITRRLSNARATLQFYEDQLQATLAELSRTSAQLAEINQSVEAAWKVTEYPSGTGNHVQG